MSLQEALLKVVGPFPVAGLAWWGEDWHAPRCCPFPHLHQGLDIFAPAGTPLVAAADGYISQKVDSPSSSGLGLEITDGRNIQYFYAHLSAFEPGIEVGTEVKIGQVIGYVGDTGNARGTIPHLHFERQPDGVPAPPKPWVDRWLKIAQRKALRLVQEVTGKKPKVERLTFRLTRLFDLVDAERSDIHDAATGDAGGSLMLTGLHPAVTYGMARNTAGTMAWEIDWGEEAVDQIASGFQEYQQEMTEQSLMGILQESGTEPTSVPAAAGILPGSPGVAVAEGIGDPSTSVTTVGGAVVSVPAAPGSLTAFEATKTEAGPLSGAPEAAVPSNSQITGTGTIGSASSFGASGSRSRSWRSAFFRGLTGAFAVYGALSTPLPGLTETVWHEIVAAIQDERVKARLYGEISPPFPAAARTP